MVAQGKDGRYTLGMRLFEYGCRVSRAWDVSHLARPHMEQLAARINVSAVLSVREGDHVITLEQVEGHSSLRVVSDVGGRLPMHCTSQGKVFLAAMPDSEVIALLGRKPLTAYTPHTVVGMFRNIRADEFLQAVDMVVSAGEMVSAALGYKA